MDPGKANHSIADLLCLRQAIGSTKTIFLTLA